MKPYYPLTNDDFHQKRMERERLEIDLSKKIEDLFKDSSVLEPLKNMFQPAFSSFVNPPPDYQHRAVLDGYLDGVCQQNDTLNIWGDYNQHPSLRGLSNVIMDHRADWTVSHCSDLIRLWGEIVEKPPPSLS